MNLGGRQTRREGLGAGGDEHQDKHDTGGRRGERHRPETLALVLTLRRPHVTEKHQTGKDTRGRALCGNAETHTDTSTGEARGTRGRQTQERRRAAGGPGRAGADTRRPRSCQSAPARPPPALTSGRSRRAPGAHGRQPPAPARPRCHGERAGPRAADAEPRSGTRADARRAARRRPRRPAAREGRGEPGGGGEPPSGREATEEGDGPEAEVTPRPARPSSAQSPLPSPRPLTCRHFRRAGPVAFLPYFRPPPRADRGWVRSKSLVGNASSPDHPRAQAPDPRAARHRRRCLGRPELLGPPGQPAARPPPSPLSAGPVHCPLLPGATPRPVPARQATQANVTSAAPRAGAPKPGLTACRPPRARPQPGAQRTRDLESKGFTHTGHVTAP